MGLILKLTASLVALANPEIPVTLSHGALSLVLAAHIQETSALGKMPCTSPATNKAVQALRQSTSELSELVNGDMKTYMERVSSSMEGNGRCDGGFQSVKKESEERARLSQRLGSRVKRLQSAYEKRADALLFKREMVFNGLGGFECFAKASSSLEKIEEQTKDLGTKLQAVLQSLAFEEKRFQEFKTVNAGLEARCGQSPGSGPMVRSGTGKGSASPRKPAGRAATGSHPASQSKITGIEEDAKRRSKAP